MGKRILFIATGGTIASRKGEAGLHPALAAQDLLAALPDKLPPDVQVVCRQLYKIDSTDIEPQHWQKLAKEIFTAYDDFTGFVVAHGTDTMAYTASALTFMLENLGKAVILTGSQLPVEESGSDAGENLMTAFLAAASGQPGVYIAFDGRLIEGCAARKVYRARRGAFLSVNRQAAGYRAKAVVCWTKSRKTNAGTLMLRTELDTAVAMLYLMPGSPVEILRLLADKGCHGIIIAGYGAGGVPAAYLADLAYAVKKGCVVVCTTQCLYDGADLSVY